MRGWTNEEAIGRWAVFPREALDETGSDLAMANLTGHSGVRIIRISSLESSGASRSLPGQRPISFQPRRV